jgi:methanogenic corrinoid protein MtbC1
MVGTTVRAEYRRRYFDLVTDARVEEAVALCVDLLEQGTPPDTITLRLLRPVQREIGRLWALGSWTIAQEHAATAVTDTVLGTLGALVPGDPQGEPVVVACPESEWHALAARMIAQLLRWRGVATDYVGTVPSDAALDQMLSDRQPRALALSCSTTAALPGAARAVAVAARRQTPLLAGGVGFGPRGRYARAVGITAWDPSPAQAVRRLARWQGADPPSLPPVPPEPLAYRRLLRHRDELSADLVRGLLSGREPPDPVSGIDVVADAAEQVVSLGLAAARTGTPAILDDGLASIAAVLRHLPEPMPTVAARLSQVARKVLGRYCDLEPGDLAGS